MRPANAPTAAARNPAAAQRLAAGGSVSTSATKSTTAGAALRTAAATSELPPLRSQIAPSTPSVDGFSLQRNQAPLATHSHATPTTSVRPSTRGGFFRDAP